MKQKLIALLLTVAMLCTVILPSLTIPASAGGWMDDYEYDEKTHTLTVNSMDDPSGYLNNEYYWQQLPWFPIRREVEKVILKETVTQIPNYAFREFTAITSVNIPEGVGSIGRCAFFDCSNLEAVTIPASVTSIGENVFNFCPKLSAIRVDNDNPKYCNDDSGALLNKEKTNLILFPKGYSGAYIMPNSITSIATDAFLSCTGLTSIILSESLTSLDDYAFSGCSSLSSITISNGLTSIGYYAFGDCVSLTTITLPDSITKIGERAFSGCTALVSISIPKNVTSIENGTFSGCSGLESIFIPNGVRSIEGWALSDCTSLTNIAIPESVTNIESWAFSGCTGLTNITIPESVTNIGEDAFNNCENLSGIWVNANNPAYSSDECGVLYNKEETVLILVPRKAALGDYVIPEGVTNIGESSTFYGCTGLTSIVIPSSVTSIGDLSFGGCSNLTSVTIPSSVTSIGDFSFGGCTNLMSVTIPSSVTSIGRNVFYGCINLSGIWVDTNNTAYCSDKYGVLYNKGKTELLQVPAKAALGDYVISGSVTNIGDWTFAGCTGLKSIIIPESVTSIGLLAFADCSGLKSVCFMGDAPEIDESVFQIYDESGDKYINIPGLTLYYIEGKEGWTTPTWGEDEYPTATWDGVNIPQPPHEHSYTAVVTAPTCTAQGYTTHTCACGESYKDTYTDALGHNYKNGICTRCGAKDPSYKPDDKPVETIEFSDVSPAAWYAGAVDYAVSNKLMNGMGGGKFEPNGSMTRAMLVTVLWRYAGSPAEGTNGFSDVPNGDWYTQAVAWASKNGVVNGVGNGRFDPNGKITREQMAVILFRYANQQGINTGKRGDFGKFTDANRVSSYAVDALQWAVAEGIVGGSSEGGKLLLNPQGNATRAEVATILMRFLENVMK